MVACDVCGSSDRFLFACEHCEVQYCRDHRAPENHLCADAPVTTSIFQPEQKAEPSPSGQQQPVNLPSFESVRSDLLEASAALRSDLTGLGDGLSNRLASLDITRGGLGLPDNEDFRRWMPTVKAGVVLISALLAVGLVVAVVLSGGMIDVLATSTDPVNGGLGDGGGQQTVDPPNETSVELLFADELNEYRQQEGVQGLEYNRTLAAIAEYHSEDMAARNYTKHTGPDGETVDDRYRRFDYECDAVSELILFTRYSEEIPLEDGSMRFDSEGELARGILDLWLQSPPHRNALLSEQWDQVGLGVQVTTTGRVFVTLNAC